MDRISTELIGKALDGLAMRQLHTAQNIANANSPGYRPVRVSFEDSLRAAANGGGPVSAVTPQISAQAGEGMRLDMKLATAAQTAMRYGGLIDILSRQMAVGRSALTWGG
jgi:flagellar basal-body rod protein FlgB